MRLASARRGLHGLLGQSALDVCPVVEKAKACLERGALEVCKHNEEWIVGRAGGGEGAVYQHRRVFYFSALIDQQRLGDSGRIKIYAGKLQKKKESEKRMSGTCLPVTTRFDPMKGERTHTRSH